MADNTHKSPEELKKMAEEIRRNVQKTLEEVRAQKAEKQVPPKTDAGIRNQPGDIYSPDASLTLEVDTLSPSERSVPERKNAEVRGGDDFWDLGKPKPRVYGQPKFSAASLSVTDVRSGTDSTGETEIPAEISVDVSAGGSIRDDEAAVHAVQPEKILPREAYNFRDRPRGNPSGTSSGSTGRVVNTVDGPRALPDSGERVVTSSYRRKAPVRKSSPQSEARRPAETVKTYTPDGILLRQITVRTWESDAEFYGRFASDARQSHHAAPKLPFTQEAESVPYFSYVPQYAHMNLAQVEYYRWLRENIRHGRYPVCDLPYLQLYIFEIINLPDEIPPAEGVKLLAAVWLHYRKLHPRLDGYLCEWLPDYCMIGGCPLPDELRPILHEIVPKAQFKEFYLNSLAVSDSRAVSDSLAVNDSDELGKIILEVSSDYDYHSSRYYKDNAEAYDTHISAAVTAVLREAYRNSRGIFAMDRVYKMTRDSYCGAIVSSGIKRRLDIEFLSFTRRADTRQAVTAIAKYTENKLRMVLGIKAKLGVDKITPEDSAVIDAYFEPMMPAKLKKSKEDRYMPDDYLKNYESESSGFDFAAAQAIEAQSWINTSRLTGDESLADVPPVPEYTPDEEPVITGELSSSALPAADENTEAASFDEIEPFDAVPDFVPQDTPITVPEPAAAPVSPAKAGDGDMEIRGALEAALLGEFRLYCRKNNLYEGEIADRVNSIFLDELGDVVLENSGGGFALIEDYREDVENWLS